MLRFREAIFVDMMEGSLGLGDLGSPFLLSMFYRK